MWCRVRLIGLYVSFVHAFSHQIVFRTQESFYRGLINGCVCESMRFGDLGR